MLSRGTAQASILRPLPPISDGAGGWYSPDDGGHLERATVRMASHTERERGNQEGVKISFAIAFRAQADVRRGDVLEIRDMPRLVVVAIPDEAIPGRTTKTIMADIEVDQHGEE